MLGSDPVMSVSESESPLMAENRPFGIDTHTLIILGVLNKVFKCNHTVRILGVLNKVFECI